MPANVDRMKPLATPARAGRRSGRLVSADFKGDSRLFFYLLGTFIARLDRERRGLYEADLELSSVAITVGLAAIEPGMRDAEYRAKHRSFDSVIGLAGQRAINALSVSQATGIPRETVRRKLKRLVELGLLAEQSRGRYVTRPGVPQRPEQTAAFERGMGAVVAFMNECLANGLVRWENDREA